MSKQPLVSIIIPTFNRAHLIGETLDSVLAQTYQNWECIVVDDGSTDGTEQLMATYCAKDLRFQYHHRPADRLPGGNAARNYGFELSKGMYVNWFDSDDLMDKNKLSLQISSFIKSSKSNVSVCHSVAYPGGVKLFNKQIVPIKNQDRILDYVNARFRFTTDAPVFKKSFLIQQGIKFNEGLKRGQEYEFFGKLIPFLEFVHLDDVLVYYRRDISHKSIAGDFNCNYYAEFLEPRFSLFKFYKGKMLLNFKLKIFFYLIFKRVECKSGDDLKVRTHDFLKSNFTILENILFYFIFLFHLYKDLLIKFLLKFKRQFIS